MREWLRIQHFQGRSELGQAGHKAMTRLDPRNQNCCLRNTTRQPQKKRLVAVIDALAKEDVAEWNKFGVLQEELEREDALDADTGLWVCPGDFTWRLFQQSFVGKHLQQLLNRLLCPWVVKHEFETHALSGPDIHDARKCSIATLVQQENNVHFGKALQFQSDICLDVTSGLADVLDLPSKQVPGIVCIDLRKSSAREATA
jgi:hypothetical protein